MHRKGGKLMIGNLSDVAVTVVEGKKGEGEGPGAHQGAGPGAERENLTLVKKDLTLGDHLGRARITMIEKKRHIIVFILISNQYV